MQAEQRASKKQRELLNFIDGFIKGNGYGPSYREVMRALDYKSVSTVAIHVDGLIAKGLLRKRDHSARSLEVVTAIPKQAGEDSEHIRWLKREIKKRESSEDEAGKKEAETLRNALDILDKTAD